MNDTSGGDIPTVTIPPTWSAGKTDGLLDASINPTHEKRTKPVPPSTLRQRFNRAIDIYPLLAGILRLEALGL